MEDEDNFEKLFYDEELERERAGFRAALIWICLALLLAGPVVLTLWRKL